MRFDHRRDRCHPERYSWEPSGYRKDLDCEASVISNPRSFASTLRMTFLCAVCGFIFGCASVPGGKSVVSEMPAKPDASEVEFWHTLQTRPLATNDDAFHGLLIYLDGNDASTDYPSRVGA